MHVKMKFPDDPEIQGDANIWQPGCIVILITVVTIVIILFF